MKRQKQDAGFEVIEHVFNEMKIDGEWSTWQERGFTWWGKDFAQTVWAEPPFEDEGFQVCRLHARTDLLDGFEASDKTLVKISALNRFASLNALVT